MRDFGYTARGREVTEAQNEVHASFAQVVDRHNKSDPNTQRWLDAIDRFNKACVAVYSKGLSEFDKGNVFVEEIPTTEILNFLEADPFFFRSGYMKAKVLTEIKRRSLDARDRTLLQDILIGVVEQGPRPEFRYYCRAARSVDDKRLRQKLTSITHSDDPDRSQRAKWMLATLEPNYSWRDIKRRLSG